MCTNELCAYSELNIQCHMNLLFSAIIWLLHFTIIPNYSIDNLNIPYKK